MRLIIYLFLMAAYTSGWTCTNKIDSSNVMLFIDLNDAGNEIETARKAACKRGQRFVVVPKDHQEYKKHIDQYIGAIKESDKCYKRHDALKCSAQAEKLIKARAQLDTFTSSRPSIKIAMATAFKELKDQKASLGQISISGHDGGGDYSGFKGALSRSSIGEIIKQYPEINKVSSLLLLGCYTTVQKEVLDWKNIFPNVRMIAGYDDSAPFSDKPAGHDYITQILMKEPELLKMADEKKLTAFAKAHLPSMSQIRPALYLRCEEGQGLKDFYYASQEGRKFSPIDMNNCIKNKNEILSAIRSLNSYQTGESDPPKDTQNGPLRKLYSIARSNEHCQQMLETHIDTNAFFNLLFSEGVKKSFADYYKDDLAEAEKVLATITPGEMKKNFDKHLGQLDLQMNKLEADLKQIQSNFPAYLKQLSLQVSQLKTEWQKMSSEPSYKALLEKVNAAARNPRAPQFQLSPDEKLKLKLHQALRDKLVSAENNFNTSSKGIGLAKLIIEFDIKTLRENKRHDILAYDQLSKDPEAIKKLFVPTAQNLSKRTRKEILANIHSIHRVLGQQVLSQEQRKTLGWVAYASTEHFQHHQNPFSWHEFNGKAEAPSANPVRLSNYKGQEPKAPHRPVFSQIRPAGSYLNQNEERGFTFSQ